MLAINRYKLHTLYTYAPGQRLYAVHMQQGCHFVFVSNEILVYECNGTSCGPHSVIQIEMMYVKASFIEH